MRLRLSVLVSLILLPSLQAWAGTWIQVSNFWLYTSLTSSPDATIRVAVGGSFSNPELCSATVGYLVLSSLSAKNKDRIYSTLLAASMAQRPVYLYLSGCEQNRPGILVVALNP